LIKEIFIARINQWNHISPIFLTTSTTQADLAAGELAYNLWWTWNPDASA
jgi:hypothetical protein